MLVSKQVDQGVIVGQKKPISKRRESTKIMKEQSLNSKNQQVDMESVTPLSDFTGQDKI